MCSLTTPGLVFPSHDRGYQRLVNEDLIVLNSDGTVDFVRPCIDEEIFHQDDIEYEDAEVVEFETQDQE